MPAFAASAPAGQQVPAHVTTVVQADEKSGHLVRSVVVQPKVIAAVQVDRTAAPAPLVAELQAAQSVDLESMIDRIAAEQGVEESLVHSVIRAESNYNPAAVSPKGAQGIMQLIPSTARRFGVSNSFDARENVLGGVKYLKFLLDYYHEDYVRVIAAYNAGEAAVDKYNGVPPFPETRNYVWFVARNLKIAREKRASAQQPAAPAAAGETYRRIETSVGSDGRVYYRTP